MTVLPGMFLHKLQAEVFRSPHRFKVVCTGRRWGKCLAPETRIAMADGSWVEIMRVKPGDMVLTLNEDTYRIEAKEVQHLLPNGIKDTVVVRTAGRSIRCTPNHPFLVNNTWTDAKDIKSRDLIAVPKSLPSFGDKSCVDYELDLLAIWLAEGNRQVISNTTPEILQVVRDASAKMGLSIRSDNGIDWLVTDGLGKGSRKTKNAMRRMLEKDGLWWHKSKTKFIPDWVYRLPERQLARFLNLFFATDGCINHRAGKTWAVEIGLANERMVRQIAELLLKFGVRGQISHKIHKACGRDGKPYESWRFIASDSKAVISFCERIGALSKEIAVSKALAAARASAGSCNTYLPVPYDDFVDHLPDEKPSDELRLCLNSWRKQSTLRCSLRRYEQVRGFADGFFDSMADGDIAWEEVLSVDPSSEVETFDLTIEGNHNFFAEGFCTHNTVYARAELLRAAKKPRQLVWYVAPTYRMAKQIMWVELLECIPKAWIVKSNETSLEITLVNGSRICLRGGDKPDTLRGVGINFLVIDEVQDIKPEIWFTVLRPTLASTRGKAVFCGTPKAFTFLHDLYQRGQNEKFVRDRIWKSWQFPTITSPFIPVSEIESAKEDMDERSFRQEFLANFESMSGQVYYQFDRKKHIGSFPFNPKLPIWIGQDFNVDPMSSVIIQRQTNGDLWVVDEIYLRSSNTNEVCDELEKRYWRYLRQCTVYPDPAGANRGTTGRGESDLDIFRERNFTRLRYRKKHPPVADRVNAVNKMLLNVEGKIRLHIDERCKHLIDSFEKTVYRKGSYEVDKSMGVEHATDAIGYPIELEFPRRKFEPMGISI